MAVARIELTVREVDWLVANLPKPEDLEQRRAVREIKRAQRMAHEAQVREQATRRRQAAAFRTAPGKTIETLDYGRGR